MLGKRVLSLILAFSSALAFLVAAVQLAFEYREDVGAVERRLNQIESADAPSIAYSLWTFDRTSLRSQVDGIMRADGVRHVDVRANTRNVWSSYVAAGIPVGGDSLVRDIPLTHTRAGGEIELIGSLHVEASLDDIYASLLQRGLVILSGQFIKTVLVSAFILFVVHMLITRHLLYVAAHVRHAGDAAPPLKLDRKKSDQPDELDMIVDAFNERADLLTESRLDPATGLANSRWFTATAAQERARAERQGTPLALLVIDVDHFKQFNARCGEHAGDSCLLRIAGTLKTACKRPGDLAARLEGQKFACLLPDTDLTGAAVMADSLCRAIRELGIQHAGSQHGRVTVSIGVAALSPTDDRSVDDLFSVADELLRTAKAAGRNTVRAAPF